MCAGALLQARIDRVVYGAPNRLLGADGSWIDMLQPGRAKDGVNDDGGGCEQEGISDEGASQPDRRSKHPFHPNLEVRDHPSSVFVVAETSVRLTPTRE